jgi:hypothetical protein
MSTSLLSRLGNVLEDTCRGCRAAGRLDLLLERLARPRAVPISEQIIDRSPDLDWRDRAPTSGADGHITWLSQTAFNSQFLHLLRTACPLARQASATARQRLTWAKDGANGTNRAFTLCSASHL